MKKILLSFILIITFVFMASCDENSKKELKIIAPSGTPSLALSTYALNAIEKENASFEIVAGSDPLIAAFTSASHDIIVAPINLGAKMYQTYHNYVLYKAFVWGNLYIASKNEFKSLQDLNGKSIVTFGKNSTPDIVLKAILSNYKELNIEISYASDVTEANTLLASNKADYIVSAEPSLSKLKDKFNLSVLDLQDEWAKITKNASYPQAGIFVKKELTTKAYVKEELRKMSEAVKDTIINKENCSNKAVKLHSSFETLGVDTLVKAIPYCHFDILEDDHEAVLYYLSVMKELGFGKQMGEILPDEGFFY